jgi:hypothetical protein
MAGLWAARAGEDIVLEGVRHIRNSDVPAHGTESLALEEVWRVGGGEDEDLILGLVTRVRADAEGRVHVFDAQMHRVLVLSPQGELEGTYFRQGEGPGEVRMPRDMLLAPDGGLAVLTGPRGQLVRVDRGSDPAGTIVPQGTAGPVLGASGAWRGGTLVLSGDESVPGARDLTSTRKSFLASFAPDGRELTRYLEQARFIDYQNNYRFIESDALCGFLWNFDVGPDGRVYAAAERNRYAITVYRPDGSVDRVIERAFESRRRSEVEKQRMRALVDRRFRTFPFDLTVEIADTEPDINWTHRGLTVLADGSLWVRHSRSASTQGSQFRLAFDVFDAEGHYDRQVIVTCPGSGLSDGVFPIGGDRFVQVRGFVDAMRTLYGGGQGGFEGEGEPDPVEIICYRARR